MTLQNERFEELLSRQLAAELEPQRGRAAAAFKAQIAAEKAEREARQIAGGSKYQVSWARREISKPAAWLWTGVPSLVAACLAVVVTLQLVERPTVMPTDTGIAFTQPGTTENLTNGSQGGVRGVGGGGTVVDYRDPSLSLPPAPEPYPYRLPQ